MCVWNREREGGREKESSEWELQLHYANSLRSTATAPFRPSWALVFFPTERLSSAPIHCWTMPSLGHWKSYNDNNQQQYLKFIPSKHADFLIIDPTSSSASIPFCAAISARQASFSNDKFRKMPIVEIFIIICERMSYCESTSTQTCNALKNVWLWWRGCHTHQLAWNCL